MGNKTIKCSDYSLMLGKDPWNLLRQYAATFAPPRSGSLLGARGWNSWYDLHAKVTAEDIVNNAAVIAEKLKGDEPFTLVIDDGWEKEWGTWEPNDKFPDGMAPVASAIKEKGLVPGIWLAPLLVKRARRRSNRPAQQRGRRSGPRPA